jgi:hypothetical protein
MENGVLIQEAMLPPDTSGVQLSPDEVARFARHLILPEVGMEGQKRLKAASVLCVGTGGLGSPLLLYLAAAGRNGYSLMKTFSPSRLLPHSPATQHK